MSKREWTSTHCECDALLSDENVLKQPIFIRKKKNRKNILLIVFRFDSSDWEREKKSRFVSLINMKNSE